MGVAGEYLNMTCTLNLSDARIDHQYNASDLYFNVSGHEVKKAPWVQVINESTVQLYYLLRPDQHRSHVECVLDMARDTAYIGHVYLWVGCKLLVFYLHVCLRHVYDFSFLLFFVVFLPHDPNLTVGSYLNLSCQINTSHPILEGVYDARNIYFELHRDKLNSKFVKVASNFSQADLSFPNISIASDQKFIRCLIDTGPDERKHILVGVQHILVGCEYTFLKI